MMEKVALVTGSSRGIGAATATLLAREGWAVCINYLEQREKAEALVRRLRDGCLRPGAGRPDGPAD